MSVDRSVVDQFHRVLVEEIRAQAPRYLSGPFTVAEIYQTLVPYRTHRDRIGVELNGDYEDALLHLLAGVGGYLELDSEPARRRLQRELDTSNPDTGVFREFAAVDVRLNSDEVKAPPELALDGKEPDTGGKEDEPAVGASKTEPDIGGKTTSGDRKASPQESSARESSQSKQTRPALQPKATKVPSPKRTSGAGSGSTPGSSVPEACPDCSSDLPARDNLRFCPFCGANVFIAPCEECGEVLDRDWSFCIACGTPTAA